MNNKSDGGMWIRESEKNGNKYLSGVIEVDGKKVNFVAFKNNYKNDGDKKPDYVIKLKDNSGSHSSQANRGGGHNDNFGDDIPF